MRVKVVFLVKDDCDPDTFVEQMKRIYTGQDPNNWATEYVLDNVEGVHTGTSGKEN